PTLLDYNEEYKTDEQKALFYGEDAYRSSDHDPVIVDLDLNGKDSSHPDDDKKNGIFDFLSELMNWLSQLFKRN
ncbi:MAG: hypothetical protein ACN6NN_10745, partial [Acinetobacter calcoaceticus]